MSTGGRSTAKAWHNPPSLSPGPPTGGGTEGPTSRAGTPEQEYP